MHRKTIWPFHIKELNNSTKFTVTLPAPKVDIVFNYQLMMYSLPCYCFKWQK